MVASPTLLPGWRLVLRCRRRAAVLRRRWATPPDGFGGSRVWTTPTWWSWICLWRRWRGWASSAAPLRARGRPGRLRQLRRTSPGSCSASCRWRADPLLRRRRLFLLPLWCRQWLARRGRRSWRRSRSQWRRSAGWPRSHRAAWACTAERELHRLFPVLGWRWKLGPQVAVTWTPSCWTPWQSRRTLRRPAVRG